MGRKKKAPTGPPRKPGRPPKRGRPLTQTPKIIPEQESEPPSARNAIVAQASERAGQGTMEIGPVMQMPPPSSHSVGHRIDAFSEEPVQTPAAASAILGEIDVTAMPMIARQTHSTGVLEENRKLNQQVIINQQPVLCPPDEIGEWLSRNGISGNPEFYMD